MKKLFKAKTLKFALVIIALFVILILVIYTLLLSNIASQTKSLLTSTNLSQDLNDWAKKIEFLKIFPDTENSQYSNILVMRVIDTYTKNYSKFNQTSLVKLPKLGISGYKETELTDPDVSSVYDDKFFEGEKYNFNVGPIKYTRLANFKISIDDSDTGNIQMILANNDVSEYNADITGSLTKTEVINLIKSDFNSLLGSVKNNNIDTLKQLIVEENSEDIAKQVLSIVDINKKIESLSITSFDLQIKETDNILFVGKLNFSQNNSDYKNSINVIYDRSLKEYKFANIFDIFSLIPAVKIPIITTQSTDQIQTISCTDCTLAPVDKLHSLPSTYIPSSLKNVSLPGGGQLSNNANTALNELSNNASSQGISISVISAYRSYQTQITTFNYWVSQQKKNGLSQADAEIQANKISARAGQSEHQLGTTADLKCSSCGNFDNSDKNLALYKYLRENAYKFGFVISYPQGKDALTGYSFEPWHIRFIGIDLATEFFNKNYLTDPNLSSTILLRQLF